MDRCPKGVFIIVSLAADVKQTIRSAG